MPYLPQTVSKSQRISVCHLSRLCLYGSSVNLKVKDLSKWEANKYLYDITKNSYSGNTDSGRSSAGVLVWRQRQWVLMRKGRGTIALVEEGISIGTDNITNIAVLILNSVFCCCCFWLFCQSSSHQSSRLKNCFLVIFANRSFSRLLRPIQRSFCPVLTSWGFKA